MKTFPSHNDFAPKALSHKLEEDFSGHVISNKRAIVERAIASTNNRGSFASIASTSLAQSNSDTSISSLSTTNSDSHRSGKRKIFSDYWQKNQQLRSPLIDQLNSGISTLVSEPRSPLLEHYPARSAGSIDSTDAIASERHGPSPTSAVQQEDVSDFDNSNDDLKKRLSITPPRRSIFGTAGNETLPYLDRYFSKHDYMRVVSSSVDSSMESPTTSAGTDLLRKRRPRSHSYCDAAIAATRKAQQPLHSCLKRRNSNMIGCRSSDDVTTPNETESVSQRHHSVHFDSQISILAFEAPASYESVSCTDGSWTKLFER